jgi:aryl-alcohol dehydrogenase-like predicted oxidoreductase
VGARHDASIAATATRWVLDRPGVAGVILGLGRRARRGENRALFDLGLDGDDLSRLDPLFGPGPRGDVYELEREPGGPHAAILRTDLNRGAGA